MRSIRLGLLGCTVAALMAAVAVGCGATGDTGAFNDFPEKEAGDDEEEGGSQLPPVNDAAVDSGIVDAGKEAGKDGGKTDGGDGGKPKDAGGIDAAAAPTPGTTCTKQDEIVSRMCGMCGEQETICTSSDGGLAWSEYGPCGGEAGECLPGSTRPCGNCGVQTCNRFCGWSICGSEPVGSCSPGSVEYTTAGCPGGGFRKRSCATSCGWQNFTAVCAIPVLTSLWAGGAGTSTFAGGADGSIVGWGRDNNGQLGDSDSAHKPRMTPLPLGNIVSMTTGGGNYTSYGFSCAVFGDGSAKCWGNNSTSYTLGDGTTGSSATPITPTGFGANVVQVTSGYNHACGLFGDGTAKCWGYNGYGQLGNSSSTNSKVPTTVNLSGITGIYAGYYGTCAKKGEAAYCWGNNYDGQVGDGTTSQRNSPTPVNGLSTGVASMAAGYYHACALMTDGTAKCWGQNTYGQVGNNVNSSSPPDVTSPATVSGIDGVGKLEGVEEICAGYYHNCARLTDGRVACWGRNADYQLGNGDATVAQAPVPKAVAGITAATKLTCGYSHSCAIDGGKVKCWGDNEYGTLGDGTMPTDSVTPRLTTF